MLSSCFGCVAGVWNCCVLLCIICLLCWVGYCLWVVGRFCVIGCFVCSVRLVGYWCLDALFGLVWWVGLWLFVCGLLVCWRVCLCASVLCVCVYDCAIWDTSGFRGFWCGVAVVWYVV